jgi:hypothetical protein
MNKTKKFSSSMLLMGKVATLPMLIGEASADVTPTYQDITSSQLSLIELPQASKLSLLSLTSDASTSTSSYASAVLCSNSMPTTMSVVVTGVSSGESVYIFASSDKNGYVSLNPRATIGATNLVLLGVSGVANSSPNTTRAAVTIPVSMSSLSGLTSASKFYMQAIVVPAGASSPSAWRISELDEIKMGTASSSAYGSSYCS